MLLSQYGLWILMRLLATHKMASRFLAKDLFYLKINLKMPKKLLTLLYYVEKISNIQETQNIL